MKFGRRYALGAAGAALALPYLESFSRARAQEGGVPKRLVIITTGEGTLLSRWKPSATGSLVLSELLAPLEPHRDKLLVVSGIENKVARTMNGSGAHNVPGHSLLSAHRCDDDTVQISSQSMGPSIDAAVAQAIGVRPLNFVVNGTNLGENRMYWSVNPQSASDPNGPRAEPVFEDDPGAVFDRLIAPAISTSSGEPPPVATRTLRERLQAQRLQVLSGVQGSLTRLGGRVSSADRRVLEDHSQRVRELIDTLDTSTNPTQPQPTGACDASLLRPNYGLGVDAAYRESIDVMIQSLLCGVTRVVTLHDSSYDGPEFDDLVPPSAELSSRGARALSTPVSGWHAQIHGESGGSPNQNGNLIAGFMFYAAQVRYLLDRMSSVMEVNGRSLLDNSLVVWGSEFGDGAHHSTTNLPFVLAGSLQGTVATGRHFSADGYSTNDLYTSILQLFGQQASNFGSTEDSSFNRGGVSGLSG
jgi:Protein of unknown function (DUF1552)